MRLANQVWAEIYGLVNRRDAKKVGAHYLQVQNLVTKYWGFFFSVQFDKGLVDYKVSRKLPLGMSYRMIWPKKRHSMIVLKPPVCLRDTLVVRVHSNRRMRLGRDRENPEKELQTDGCTNEPTTKNRRIHRKKSIVKCSIIWYDLLSHQMLSVTAGRGRNFVPLRYLLFCTSMLTL